MFKYYLENIYNEGYIEDKVFNLLNTHADEYSWLIKEREEEKKNAKLLIENFRKYKDAHHLDINKFNKYTEFKKAVEDIMIGKVKTKSEIKKNIRQGIPGLKQGEDYLQIEPPQYAEHVQIYVPLNHKGSCAIGRNTKWCTAMENNKDFWVRYAQEKVVFFYLLFVNQQGKNDAVAVAVYDNNSSEIYNKFDKQISFRTVLDATGIPEKFFINEVKSVRKYIKKQLEKKYTYTNKEELIILIKELINMGSIEFKNAKDNSEGLYEIDNKLYINAPKSVVYINEEYEKLPIKFGKVWSFYARSIGLKSLNGLPTEVGNYMTIDSNKITSLKNCPTKYVNGIFNFDDNKITSYEGGPEVNGTIEASELTTAKGLPKKISKLSMYCNEDAMKTFFNPEYFPDEIFELVLVVNTRGKKETSSVSGKYKYSSGSTRYKRKIVNKYIKSVRNRIKHLEVY